MNYFDSLAATVAWRLRDPREAAKLKKPRKKLRLRPFFLFRAKRNSLFAASLSFVASREMRYRNANTSPGSQKSLPRLD
jgi:hypothetical protein